MLKGQETVERWYRSHHCLHLNPHLMGEQWRIYGGGGLLACFHDIRHCQTTVFFSTWWLIPERNWSTNVDMKPFAYAQNTLQLCMAISSCCWLLPPFQYVDVYVCTVRNPFRKQQPSKWGLRLWEHILVLSNGRLLRWLLGVHQSIHTGYLYSISPIHYLPLFKTNIRVTPRTHTQGSKVITGNASFAWIFKWPLPRIASTMA